MEIKLNKNNQKYVIKKGEVLAGSALLKKKENKIYDRVTYIIDNMISNKAYQYAKNKNQCIIPAVHFIFYSLLKFLFLVVDTTF